MERGFKRGNEVSRAPSPPEEGGRRKNSSGREIIKHDAKPDIYAYIQKK